MKTTLQNYYIKAMLGFCAVLAVAGGVLVFNTSTSEAQSSNACWNRYIANYASYSTTSRINTDAGYEGIMLSNGSNTLLHWFAKKDTLHYYYQNGVEECDKNGNWRTTWVLSNGQWTESGFRTLVRYGQQTQQTGITIAPTPATPSTSVSASGKGIDVGYLTLVPDQRYICEWIVSGIERSNHILQINDRGQINEQGIDGRYRFFVISPKAQATYAIKHLEGSSTWTLTCSL